MSEAETLTHPAINPENRPFWEAAAQGKLLIKHCSACGNSHFYPRATCPFCRSPETAWKQASGKAVLYSYTIMRRAAVPFVVAYVTLEEGPTMFTNLVDCEPDELAIGQSLLATYRSADDGLIRPVFKPA
jgi:uncharacterized OB-fold protein